MTTMIVWLLIGYSGAYGASPSTLATFPDKANCEFVAMQLPSRIERACIKAQIMVPK